MSGSGQAHPKEHLSSYLDDQLSLETRAAVDRHLALCEECRADVDALRRLARAVRDEEPPPVPLDLSGRITRSLDAATGAPRRGRRFVVPATIAATIMAIGILVTLQWRQGRISMPEAPAESKTEGSFTDDAKNRNVLPPPVPSPVVAPLPETAPLSEPAPPAGRSGSPRSKEAERRDDLEKDAYASGAAALAPMLKQKADDSLPTSAPTLSGGDSAVDGARERAASKVARPAAPETVVSGVVGGVAGGVGDEVPGGATSPCAERWSDSGLRCRFETQDADAAARDFGRIAVDVGGASEWRGTGDGRPFMLLVPRGRFDEVFYALRARGVTGLAASPVLPEGDGCVGIPITFTVAGEPPPGGPR